MGRTIFFFLLVIGVVLGGLMLLRRRASYQPAYRIPAYPVVPILFIVASLAIVVMQIADVPLDSAIGLGMVLVGWPVYLIWTRYRSSVATAQDRPGK